ncbi:hypothetical protein CEW87_07125 [Parazoarcus communis]|uniref:Lnb N-terminal periplasmic domain-containing protein n=1 Tax=Parazoarcus communis TaxID=41977 RepID=A0A2U8H0A9_9RHOO|nr:DUF4105 domain-containing protein [Parazoarcus communis]AWI79154.1 hypothetical protein CEW87_07125 [Parazoarcus communis]
MQTLLLRFFRVLSTLLFGMLVLGSAVWGGGFIAYAGPANSFARFGLIAVLALFAIFAVFAITRRRWERVAPYFVLLSLLMVLWSQLEPSNTRDWQDETSLLPHAKIEGDFVTVYNIRNFTYRSETDFTPSYYNKRFDLRKLEAVDLVTSHWMGPAIAHVFLSFAFADDEYLAISIEVRKTKGEAYSNLKGFFRQYELYYVVADERDVIGVRTNYRQDPPEDVYLYRTKTSPENRRRLFLEYMNRINALSVQPEFYNSLTTNCTTAIWMNTRVNPQQLPFSWKIIASGYVPEYLFEMGRLQMDDLPFVEIQTRAHINARARAAGTDHEFSKRIRTLMPGAAVEALRFGG